MDERSDGRLYSRVTRRAQAILKLLDSAPQIVLDKAVERAAKDSDEFFLKRYGRPMSLPRVREYFWYLEHIGAVNVTDGNVSKSFPLCRSDSQWAQTLADKARAALANDIAIKFSAVPTELKKRAAKIRAKGNPPTVLRLVQDLSDDRGRLAEFMKWDIYLICDAPNTDLQIRRIPALWAVK